MSRGAAIDIIADGDAADAGKRSKARFENAIVVERGADRRSLCLLAVPDQAIVRGWPRSRARQATQLDLRSPLNHATLATIVSQPGPENAPSFDIFGHNPQ
jgi:hypothetical protein